MVVNHRGFTPLPNSLALMKLDATPSSELKWEIDPPPENTLWELEFGPLSPRTLPSFKIAVELFVESVWQHYQEQTLGVILYRGALPPYEIEILADMLHQLGALLPDELPPFALFDLEAEGSYYGQLFSKELFSHIHLGFRSGPFGALRWGKKLTPLHHDAKLGLVLPLRSMVVQDDRIDSCLSDLRKRNIPYRLIAEMQLTEEWDELDDLIVFSSLLSKQGFRKVQGFIAAGGRVVVVGEGLALEREIGYREFGAEGFEPPTFCSQSRRASQAALCPDGN